MPCHFLKSIHISQENEEGTAEADAGAHSSPFQGKGGQCEALPSWWQTLLHPWGGGCLWPSHPDPISTFYNQGAALKLEIK